MDPLPHPERSGPLTLHTPRLVLRPYAAGDLEAVHAFASDPRLTTFVEWGPNTRADSREFLAARLTEAEEQPRTVYTFAITVKGGGPPLGSVGLTLNGNDDGGSGSAAGNDDGRHRAAARRTGEVGYVIAADHWGRGYATEAAAAVVRFGVNVLGLERISATCRPGNRASARVLEKTGLVLQARLPRHKLIRGQREDSLLYALEIRQPGEPLPAPPGHTDPSGAVLL